MIRKLYVVIRTANEKFITTTGAMSEETACGYFTDGVNMRVYPVGIQFYDAFPDFLLLEEEFTATKPISVKKAIALAAKYAEIEYHQNELDRVKQEYERMRKEELNEME